MKHNITLTTIEIMLIIKALRFDMQNDIDNKMAEILIEKLTDGVVKDLIKAGGKND